MKYLDRLERGKDVFVMGKAILDMKARPSRASLEERENQLIKVVAQASRVAHMPDRVNALMKEIFEVAIPIAMSVKDETELFVLRRHFSELARHLDGQITWSHYTAPIGKVNRMFSNIGSTSKIRDFNIDKKRFTSVATNFDALKSYLKKRPRKDADKAAVRMNIVSARNALTRSLENYLSIQIVSHPKYFMPIAKAIKKAEAREVELDVTRKMAKEIILRKLSVAGMELVALRRTNEYNHYPWSLTYRAPKQNRTFKIYVRDDLERVKFPFCVNGADFTVTAAIIANMKYEGVKADEITL